MASIAAPDFRAQLEENSIRYVERIGQIDRILEGPISTLIALAKPPDFDQTRTLTGVPPRFPVWVVHEKNVTFTSNNRLAQGLCIYTLQTLSRVRRRFEKLEDDAFLSSPGVRAWLARSFVPADYDARNDPDGTAYFARALEVFRSETFGTLNPLTAAQIFRTLIEAGEDFAHEGSGFMAFFAMVWPLFRRHPQPLLLGARIEPSTPTAYVTAKCLIPIDMLRGICGRRAKFLDEVATSVARLRELAEQGGYEFERRRRGWLFNAELERLRGLLLHLSEFAITGRAFRAAADNIGQRADAMRLPVDLLEEYGFVEGELRTVLGRVSDKTREVLEEAQVVVQGLRREICGRLSTPDGLRYLIREHGLRFADDLLEDEEYRNDLKQSAERALAVCQAAIDALMSASLAAEPQDANEWNIPGALTKLAEANRAIAGRMDDVIQIPAEWCRSVVDREVAYASAKNYTNFDPTELVSALLCAVRLKLMSRLQVQEAVEKALRGGQDDGSWRLGYPFFSVDDELGIRAPSADVVWTLARCIEEHPAIDAADESLFRFVDWLDRTREVFRSPDRTSFFGWKGDRIRHGPKIHVATTAYVVNALLEIRELLEYRLWELCEKRFTVLPTPRTLSSVDPVDLSTVHGQRLHSRLLGVARNTADVAEDERERAAAGGSRPGGYRDAEYSLVLHGPPGSSKTALISALAEDMWGRPRAWGRTTSRLVRITPADFTRMGGDRIDSEARLIFQLLGHVRQVTVLFDEIDDLLAQRVRAPGEPPSFMGLVVPAMLNRLQDLRDACMRQEICFILGTNYIDTIEPALLRRGRIDRCLPVVYPDHASRQAIVAAAMRKVPDLVPGETDEAPARAALDGWLTHWCGLIAERCSGWSWNQLQDVSRRSADIAAYAVAEVRDGFRRDAPSSLPDFHSHAPEREPGAAGGLSEAAFERLSGVEREIRQLIDAVRSSVTLPDYTRRLATNGDRAELRAEFIHFSLCKLVPSGEAAAVVEQMKEFWQQLAGDGPHSSLVHQFGAEVAEVLSAWGETPT